MSARYAYQTRTLALMGGMETKSSTALRVLMIGGLAAAVLGVAVWVLSAQALDRRSSESEYLVAVGGLADAGALGQAQLGVGLGVAVLVVGVIALLAGLIIRAARR